MKTIEIQQSQVAKQTLLGFAGLLALMLAMIGLEPGLWLVAQLMVIISVYWAWKNTVGLGVTLRLVYDGAWWMQMRASPRQPLTAVRSGWVCPTLVTAELQGPTGHYRLVVPLDAASPREHWELRRLLIEGMPSSETQR